MEPVQLWAAVKFSAWNGDTGALLSASAQKGLHLYGITSQPGGFDAHCAAWCYPRVASCARRQGVRLHIRKRQGLFFRIRPLLRRAGLLLGLAVFVPLLLWLQGVVWSIDAETISPGQRARAAVVLWDCGLWPGALVTQEKLATGEYALLQSGEFSWASLNFAKGRLQVEAAKAAPKPKIASGSLQGIRARCSGTVVQTNLVSGTMLVVPGQQVEEGQGLIGTARQERDGTLSFSPAAGSVRAQFEWTTTREVPLEESILEQTGATTSQRAIFFHGNKIPLPTFSFFEMKSSSLQKTRHVFGELFGLPLPFSIEETTYYGQKQKLLYRTEEQALAIARMQALQMLLADYPDAELLARKEDVSCVENNLNYTVSYTMVADICK